jgi:acetyltransferase-like isoleucine patch superfamily enzyme
MKTKIKIKMDLHKYQAVILGQIATSIWYLPNFSKLLHSIRGVKFKDRRTTFFGRGVAIDNRYPELVSIGRDVWLTAGTVILTHSFTSNSQQNLFGLLESTGPVLIEDGVFIGTCCIICPNVVIGKNSYVAAGSVVTHNVPHNVIVGGNPAKIIKKMEIS